MNRKTKRSILIALGFLALIFLSGLLYFYITLSGNPIDQFMERRAVVRFYESRYEEDFLVVHSSYDYKRREFSFKLSSQNSNLAFTTTLEETSRIDKYGQAQAIDFLETAIHEGLGSDSDQEDISFQIYISEEYTSPGLYEADLQKRLSLNNYAISFSWDDRTINEREIDEALETIAHKIEKKLDSPVGRITIRATVFDGQNYHFSEIIVDTP